MQAISLFRRPFIGPRLGSPMPLRRRSLGFTPTGEPMPTQCTDIGVRMIQEQSGYAPLACPSGPDCYDIIDATTGQLIIAKVKGSAFWAPLCAQFGYTDPGGSSTSSPTGEKLKACDLPGHPGWYVLRYDGGPSNGKLVSSTPLSKEQVQSVAAGRPIAWTTECPVNPDEHFWVLCNVSPNSMAYVDLLTGGKRLEQAGQTDQPHPLCPAPSQQSSPAATSPCPEMTMQEWTAADKAEQDAYDASGKTTVRGGCAVIKNDPNTNSQQMCYFPGPNSAGAGGGLQAGLVGTPGAKYGPSTGGPMGSGVVSCDEQWKWMCQNIVHPGDAGYQYCPGQQPPPTGVPAPTPTAAPVPAAAPAPAPAPTSAPAPTPSAPRPGGAVPISIDIQAFTPGGMGPIPAQPLMQPQPIAPRTAPAAPAAQAAPKPLLVSAPKEPEKKPLDVGSAAGIGLVVLAAIAAAAFGGKR